MIPYHILLGCILTSFIMTAGIKIDNIADLIRTIDQHTIITQVDETPLVWTYIDLYNKIIATNKKNERAIKQAFCDFNQALDATFEKQVDQRNQLQTLVKDVTQDITKDSLKSLINLVKEETQEPDTIQILLAAIESLMQK